MEVDADGFLVDDAAVDAALYAERPHEFDPVRQRKSTKGGWSGYADMVTGQADPSPGPYFTCDAQMMTIHFGIIVPSRGEVLYDNIAHCVATIQAGVEGQWVQRQISVGLGTTITVAADSVQISFQDITALTNVEAALGLTYRVTAQIVKGIRATYENPPILVAFTDIVNSVPAQQSGVVSLNASGNARYPIPPNADAIAVEVMVVGTAPDVTVFAASGAVDLKEWNPLATFGFVALPPGCTFVELQNNNAIDPVNVTVTWGIDG
jgi:hypothetical protein